jgi:hypothetical protein
MLLHSFLHCNNYEWWIKICEQSTCDYFEAMALTSLGRLEKKNTKFLH